MQVYYKTCDASGRYPGYILLPDAERQDFYCDRAQMVLLIYQAVRDVRPDKVEFFIDGAEDAVTLPARTVKQLCSGDRKPESFVIGTSVSDPGQEYRIRFPSRWHLLRLLPGDETAECLCCGRSADLGTSCMICSKCGSSLPTQVRPNGLYADLHCLLDLKLERYFIDRPWNPSRPWMGREQLAKAIGAAQLLEK